MHPRVRNSAYRDDKIGGVWPRLRPVKLFAGVLFPERSKVIYKTENIPIRSNPWRAELHSVCRHRQRIRKAAEVLLELAQAQGWTIWLTSQKLPGASVIDGA